MTCTCATATPVATTPPGADATTEATVPPAGADATTEATAPKFVKCTNKTAFDFGNIVEKLAAFAAAASTCLTAEFDNLKHDASLNNPLKTTHLQFKLGQYNQLVSWQSGIIKLIRDLMSSVIGKI